MEHRGVFAALIANGIVIGGLFWLALLMLVPELVAWGYFGMSVVLFALYGWDKRAATLGRQRTPEVSLQGVALLGGWPGGWLGQQLFRHKTRKTRFQLVFWLMVAINLGALAWLLLAAEAEAVRGALAIEPIRSLAKPAL